MDLLPPRPGRLAAARLYPRSSIIGIETQLKGARPDGLDLETPPPQAYCDPAGGERLLPDGRDDEFNDFEPYARSLGR
jgi:hypothetical protein